MLVTTMNRKTADFIETQFGVVGQLGPMNDVWDSVDYKLAPLGKYGSTTVRGGSE